VTTARGSTLEFLGGVGTVTGSKFLIETGAGRMLVDCGLDQGLKELCLRNWEPLAADPGLIDWVVLTHAHIDHTGYLPRLFHGGFRDRRGTSKHKPALPWGPTTASHGRRAGG